MKKVIVTGANGFIGSSLLKVMCEEEVRVYAIIKDINEKVDHIKDLPGVDIIYCELSDIAKLPELIPDRDIDACIHLAWSGSFGDERADYELQLTNVKYALNTVDAISKMGVKRFIGAGTLAEKDVLNYHPNDGSTPNDVSTYGIAKITMHFMTKVKCTKLGIEHVWCYLSNTYGVGNTTNNFVNMASRLMLNGKRASFTSGNQIYDFVYISDTARAIYFAASKGRKNTAYYLGSTQQRRLKEYIQIIRDCIDPSIELHLGEVPFNGNPLPIEAYDAVKLVNDTGFKPLVSFEEGIKKTIAWLRDEDLVTNLKTVKSRINNVIITGADGFVGSYTVKYFLEQGKNVLALDISETPGRLGIHENMTYLQCDISDTTAMLETIPHGMYDTFIHFAWNGSAGAARVDYNLQMKNALNTVECLKVAKELGCSRFIGAGSIMEYEVEAVVHAQESQPGLEYIYGMGKHIAHSMCKSVAAKIGIDLLWPMITNAYGVGELSPRFVNNTLRKIIKGESLQFTAATQNYDFVYVTDVAKAFYLVSEYGKPFCEYMIGSGNARPLREFILEMQQACAPDSIPIFGEIPFTGTNMPLKTFDITAINKDCGYMPDVSFAEGTKKTMEWLKKTITL